MIKRNIFDIIIASIALLIIDGVWIGIIMKPKYDETVKHIQGDVIQLNFIAANLAYIFLLIGLYYFVLSRINTNNPFRAFIEGAMYGMAVYGTFDFTSAAIFKNYHFSTALIDLSWGTFLCGISSFITIYARRYHESPIEKIE
jgi:uncharacterized membrane protein